MQLFRSLLLLLTPLLVAARSCPAPASKAFTVMTLRSGDINIHFNRLLASQSKLIIGNGTTVQGEVCEKQSYGDAIFEVKQGELYLYKSSEPRQKFYVLPEDGLGKIGFTTGDEEAPAGSVRKGWTLEHPDDTADQTFLNFEGKTLTACGGKAPFSVWVDEGANDKGCRGFSSYVIESEPISCTYTTA